jgi:hypothetical protein
MVKFRQILTIFGAIISKARLLPASANAVQPVETSDKGVKMWNSCL